MFCLLLNLPLSHKICFFLFFIKKLNIKTYVKKIPVIFVRTNRKKQNLERLDGMHMYN